MADLGKIRINWGRRGQSDMVKQPFCLAQDVGLSVLKLGHSRAAYDSWSPIYKVCEGNICVSNSSEIHQYVNNQQDIKEYDPVFFV